MASVGGAAGSRVNRARILSASAPGRGLCPPPALAEDGEGEQPKPRAVARSLQHPRLRQGARLSGILHEPRIEAVEGHPVVPGGRGFPPGPRHELLTRPGSWRGRRIWGWMVSGSVPAGSCAFDGPIFRHRYSCYVSHTQRRGLSRAPERSSVGDLAAWRYEAKRRFVLSPLRSPAFLPRTAWLRTAPKSWPSRKPRRPLPVVAVPGVGPTIWGQVSLACP